MKINLKNRAIMIHQTLLIINNNNREEANETEDIKMVDVSENTEDIENFYI